MRIMYKKILKQVEKQMAKNEAKGLSSILIYTPGGITIIGVDEKDTELAKRLVIEEAMKNGMRA
jgi:hypothetical protein